MRRVAEFVTKPIVLFSVVLAVVGVVTAHYAWCHDDVLDVFDDLVRFTQLPRTAGFASDLGIALWACIVVLLLSGLARLLRSGQPLAPADYGFYLPAIAFSAWLGADDRLMIHEWLVDRWGASEMAIYGAYVAGIGWWARRFWRYLCGPSSGWLWVAVAGFAVSILIDDRGIGEWINSHVRPEMSVLLEEVPKLAGICALWLHVFLLMVKPPCAAELARPGGRRS